MNRYFESRERGDVRTAAVLENRPFTCAFGFALMMSVVAASVYLSVFSDSKKEFWRHFWQSLGAVTALAVGFGFFFRREKKAPLPLRVRRLFWRAIVWGYIGAAVYLFAMVFQPYARFQLFRTIVGLGTVLPLPVIAWRLLQKNEKRS